MFRLRLYLSFGKLYDRASKFGIFGLCNESPDFLDSHPRSALTFSFPKPSEATFLRLAQKTREKKKKSET